MKNTEEQDAIIYARVPGRLRKALERERQRMSRAAGAEIQTSAVIRALLERGLRGARRKPTTARASRAA